LNCQTQRGRTALSLASQPHEIELLCAFGASIDVADSDGTTPLLRFSIAANVDCVRALLRLDADATKEDSLGRSVTRSVWHPQIKPLLLEHSKKSVSVDFCCCPESNSFVFQT
jgi:ankyrin repeat protein